MDELKSAQDTAGKCQPDNAQTENQRAKEKKMMKLSVRDIEKKKNKVEALFEDIIVIINLCIYPGR